MQGKVATSNSEPALLRNQASAFHVADASHANIIGVGSVLTITSGRMAQASETSQELKLLTNAHVKYITSLDTRRDELDYWLTEHLRLNGVYWGLVGLHLLGRPDALPRQETIDFVLSCQHESGGFGAAPGHDAHMLSTVSAVQILAMVDAFDELEARGKGKDKIAKCE